MRRCTTPSASSSTSLTPAARSDSTCGSAPGRPRTSQDGPLRSSTAVAPLVAPADSASRALSGDCATSRAHPTRQPVTHDVHHGRGDRAGPARRQDAHLSDEAAARRLQVPYWGDIDPVIAEQEEFIAGQPSERPIKRALATVVSPTSSDRPSMRSPSATRRWRDLLDRHDAMANATHERRIRGPAPIEVETLDASRRLSIASRAWNGSR